MCQPLLYRRPTVPPLPLASRRPPWRSSCAREHIPPAHLWLHPCPSTLESGCTVLVPVRYIGFESLGERSSASSSVIKVRSMSRATGASTEGITVSPAHRGPALLMSAVFRLCGTLPSMESRTHIQSTADPPPQGNETASKGRFSLFWQGHPLPRRHQYPSGSINVVTRPREEIAANLSPGVEQSRPRRACVELTSRL